MRRQLEDSTRLRLVVFVAAIALVALLVWLLALRGADAAPADAEGALGPVAMSAGELADFAARAEHPIYWAGEEPEATFEVTRTEDGVFIRYLDADAEVGDERPSFLTVASYPMDDAHEVVVAASEEAGAITAETPDGMLAVTNEASMTSVYVADEGSSVQVEIFDPDAGSALRIATSGDLQPIR